MRHIIIIYTLVVLLVSCDTTKDYYSDKNNKPILLVKGEFDDDFSIKSSDSMKINQEYYQLFYKIEDEEKCKLKVEYDNIFSVDIEDDRIKIYAKSLGVGDIKLYVNDSFGSKDEMKIRLTCFDNLPPVAFLEIEDIPGYYLEKKLDASKSYDQDSKYGGEIILYRFLLNGIEIEKTYHSYIHFTFLEAGNYEVGVQVQDNDNEWSKIYYKTLTIK